MIKEYQPIMNGFNLTKITERLGKEKLIALMLRDTLPLRKPQRSFINSSLVRRRISGRKKIKTLMKCESRLSSS